MSEAEDDDERGGDEEVEEEVEEEEEEGGEDLMEEAEKDYVAIPELDRYDERFLSSEEVEAMDWATRREAEKAIEARTRNVEAYLDEEYEEDEEKRRKRRRQIDEAEEGPADVVNMDTITCPLREWIAQESTRLEIKRKFREFLSSYTGSVGEICAENRKSLKIDYIDLADKIPKLAVWVSDAPRDILEILDEVGNDLVRELFPSYDPIRIRIANLPVIDKIDQLRKIHRNKLVRVKGVVTKRSNVFPQLTLSFWDCQSCHETLGPFADGTPTNCPNCSGLLKLNSEKNLYRNFQRLTLQSDSVKPGAVPRSKEVILLDDLVDVARPGEVIDVTGIYSHVYDTQPTQFPVYATRLEANWVTKGDFVEEGLNITESEKRGLFKLSRDSNILDILLKAFAPSIHGHSTIKHALLTALVGGCAKEVAGKHRIRGDINVLLVGDPGCAKSQLLKYCCQLNPRAVYATGKGASAVGLTAGVHKDPITKEWTLEGGALVLADNGICCIDEFDKMNDQDRTSIHEAMEQQSISVSKAGIVTSLKARCSVVAAANPINGQYDSTLNFTENVELTDPILQRFDILCVLQDIVDPVRDLELASSVVKSHRLASSSERDEKKEDESILPQETLKKYLNLAKSTCFPRLTAIDQEKVAKLYSQLRLESISLGGVPVAVRHLESLMRLAEAHAKIGLRDHVTSRDLDSAISIVVQSFVKAQKFSVRQALDKAFSKYYSKPTDDLDFLLYVLRAMALDLSLLNDSVAAGASSEVSLLFDDILDRVADFGIHQDKLDTLLKSPLFLHKGFKPDFTNRLVSLSTSSSSFY